MSENNPSDLQRYAVVDAENHVINIIVWDGAAEFKLPAKCRTVQSDTLNIYDTAT